VIDDALRKAAIENKVAIKLLISYWNHSRESEDYFLRSLEALSHSIKGVDIQIVGISNIIQYSISRILHDFFSRNVSLYLLRQTNKTYRLAESTTTSRCYI
jgi:hypothetical protein